MSNSYAGVALLAPVTVPYERYSDQGAAWFIAQALRDLLKTSRLSKNDIDGLAVSSFSLAPDSAVNLSEQFGTSLRWIEQIPMGGASAVVAVRRAARAIQAGDADVIACIGADTAHQGGFRDLVANFSAFSRDAVYPYGAAGPNSPFAMITRAYMDKYGATREDFGRICIAQRENATHNPLALLRKPLGMDEYLSARAIAEPLHLFDCVMPCAGAEGFLVTSTERAQQIGAAHATILAADERYNAFAEDPVQLRGGWEIFRDGLYEQADCKAQDMDFVQTYDDYPVIAMMQLEDLGFCAKGEGPGFVRKTDFTCAGDLPMNTCGGQLSAGQAGFAGGHLSMVEAIRQLTDSPLGNAVPNAQLGIVSGYGMINYDRGLCSAAAIVARGKA
ncbi:MAG: thiolase family protein [Gammaproteobacteria bacterium]